MVGVWNESKSTGHHGESHELWQHRQSGAFYAVRLADGRIRGACGLITTALLAQRHGLSPSDFQPTVGARLAAERNEYAVVEQW